MNAERLVRSVEFGIHMDNRMRSLGRSLAMVVLGLKFLDAKESGELGRAIRLSRARDRLRGMLYGSIG